MNAKQLHEFACSVFEKRRSIERLWQEIAEHFAPQRADFTIIRQEGEDYAGHLFSSYPLIVARDLKDQVGQMLRPVGRPWFQIEPEDPERNDHDAKVWLQAASNVQRKAMYDPVAKLDDAAKVGDLDFSVFGQCVLSSEIVWDDPSNGPHLLHRSWHMRDVCWQEDKYGSVGNRYRRAKYPAWELYALFGDRVHSKVKQLATAPDRKRLTEIDCMHMVVQREMYEPAQKFRREDLPWVSVYYDVTNRHVVEEVPTFSPYYFIPRWSRSCAQYAYSPATTIALPDARLLQAMTRTMLDAGERVANPPTIATNEVVRSDLALYAGGVTWVDRDYDERLGEAIRPLMTNTHGLPYNIEMLQRSEQMLTVAFYLNKLRPFLPTQDAEMTAYQAGQVVAQYIRDALPLFAPMEPEYNGQLCELDFELLRRAGAFGSPYDMPASLQGAKTSFTFQSPLHDAIESQKGQKFLEMSQLLATAVQMDPSAAAVPDVVTAFREALSGYQVPQKWIRSEIVVKQMLEAEQAAKQTQEFLGNLKDGAAAVKDLGSAAATAAQTGMPLV